MAEREQYDLIALLESPDVWVFQGFQQTALSLRSVHYFATSDSTAAHCLTSSKRVKGTVFRMWWGLGAGSSVLWSSKLKFEARSRFHTRQGIDGNNRLFSHYQQHLPLWGKDRCIRDPPGGQSACAPESRTAGCLPFPGTAITWNYIGLSRIRPPFNKNIC